MKLKVVRYKNYGLKNSNAGEIIEHKFYYSFYFGGYKLWRLNSDCQ